MTPTRDFDVFIIGGGINGAGIARDASGRGFSVCLCDAGDFGGGTSSASTKLVHGGLRYLEHFEFRLVREALIEREILWQMAPHIIWPLRFILPHHKGLRPAWLLRLGLFLYDHLGGRKLLPATSTINLTKDIAGKSLKPEFKKAFEYSDCWVEDSRLVILNLQDAQVKGADIRPRTSAQKAQFKNGKWQIELADKITGEREHITASVIINATGPWVDEVMKNVFGKNDSKNVRLVRGSHIVIKKKYQHDRAYIFQNSDERIIFAIPYENDYTLIGTTDAEQKDIFEQPKISQREIDYLCDMASEYFKEPVSQEDVVWTYSGVRPLYDDGASKAQEATRDYVIRQEETLGDGSLFNIFGGKITTFRRLAESVLEEIEDRLGKRKAKWTAGAVYSGGDFATDGYYDLVAQYTKQYPFIETELMQRLVRLYGTNTLKILKGAEDIKDLGVDFGEGLYQCEVEYLMKHEWVFEASDILYRRTKLGIRMTKAQSNKLSAWIEKHR
jgi:glycerol-3-phosphate dehydrogenase